MAIEVVPGVLDEVETGAVVQRHTTTALAGGRAGVCGATDLAVSQSSTPAMTVRVAAGYALVAGSTTTYQGLYSFHNDAAVDDLAISPGDPTNPRNDIVVAQVRDASYAGSDSDARLFVVEGTPAGAPSDPSLPASCLALARVRVDANESTSIVNGDITDLRVFGGDYRFSALLPETTSTWSSPVAGGITISNGTVTANYCRIGPLVVAVFQFIQGSSGGVTGDVTFTLPVTGVQGEINGFGYALDANGVDYTLGVSPNSSTVVRAQYDGSVISPTVPFTWASTDRLGITLVYFAAA